MSSNVTGGSSSSRITGGSKNGGGNLAMIALPIPAPRVRKVPILVEKEVNIKREVQAKGPEQKEEIQEPKDKAEEGRTWKARTGLSPGKWATRSLRRSKEEPEVKVAPLQRRGSLRGSLRLRRRGGGEFRKEIFFHLSGCTFLGPPFGNMQGMFLKVKLTNSIFKHSPKDRGKHLLIVSRFINCISFLLRSNDCSTSTPLMLSWA